MSTIAPPAIHSRVLLPDGSAKTVEKITRSDDGRTWLHFEDRSANRADRCERVDTSRVAEARATARRTARTLQAGGDTGPAVTELGEALRYLAQADPDTLIELSARAARVTVDIPRLDVVPGDILHQYGVRLNVLDTAVSTHDDPVWWASVHGVTGADRQATYRSPWRTSINVQYAACDVVTVERIIPALPA
ncbi:hypothetical protein ACFWVB_02470 [Streptomyces microflavus]|uniref:hypothetical protein n=1 Tax=Streptomyces microflavus TaxID=1919 RepID=UPI003661D560